MTRIVIFASGSGSNAENIYEYFKNDDSVKITCILTNSKSAKVLERAKRLNVSSLVFNREELNNESKLLKFLKEEADLIVLAGFLWKVPDHIVKAFPNKIVNIHPALLPKYGGKGMYGMHVHKAVVENGESNTGITIHYVNENYDEGAVIFQVETEVLSTDTPEIVAQKIHLLEYENFPKVIASLIQKNG